MSCHDCKTLILSKQTVPNCKRNVKNCSDKQSFCGVFISNIHGHIFYRENCVRHHLCINTSATCPDENTCFLHCCAEDLCNTYDQVQNIHLTLANIKNLVSLVGPTNLLNQSVNKTTHSLASFLRCPKYLMVTLIIVILFKH